jgi:hypothetical protein
MDTAMGKTIKCAVIAAAVSVVLAGAITGTFKIVRILVVGFNDGEKWFPVQPPHFQFTIVDPPGQDV